MFGRKSQPVVGIDISSTSVKVLELSSAGSNYRVEAYGIEPLPPNAVTEKNITDVDAVGETIRKAMRRSGTKNKRCALAVAGSAVITKVITMPAALNDEEMESQIQLEADQYIPYSLEEVNLDFDVLGTTDSNPDTVDVLLAASRSENVEIRVAAAQTAGLTPEIVDIEAYAVENALQLLVSQIPGGGEGQTIAVFDIGATMTSLDVMSDHRLVYTREQPFGGKQLTEEIMRRYGLSYEEAGLHKKEGGLPENYVPDVLEPFKETIAQQVNRFLQFFYSASQNSTVDHIILAGGSAATPGIDELIETKLQTDTSIANPFANMKKPARGVNQHQLYGNAPSLLIATGLALRSFN
ncbi:MAG: pilus assembly protein PilM [Gammaproteobacteria bacterium]